ncbi:hypothetical protein BY458DRAFT_549670 [Sporodiniella umbellata]|nr:hypothetical protein BY458DRAFT_549670 [Sporodiniella umbellata]
MRSIFTISAAIAFLTATVFASTNIDLDAAKDTNQLSDAFVTFRWTNENGAVEESYDLVLEEATRIQITDYKNRGDSFEVFDNGQSLGFTSKVEAQADDKAFAATPEEALEDERFSRGEFTLEKGEHKITIKATGPYEADGHEHPELPYYDLDTSHTITITKTVWIDQEFPGAAPAPPVYNPVHEPVRDHNRDHSLPHVH